jgi:Ca-activated chloride channel family protein
MDRLNELLYGACGLALASCGDSNGSLPPKAGFHSVVQSGPQDIGEYRSIVAAGAVPARSVLDENGFFAEHEIDLPAADCGLSICAHPMLAVAPRFDGGNWTMAFVGMNTAVEASTLPAKPRHVVAVVASGALVEVQYILTTTLTREDRLSLISDAGRVTPLEGLPPRQLTLERAIQGDSTSPISLYSALADALAVVQRPGFEDYQGRVLLFPSGFSQSGLDAPEYLADVALEFARHETPISVLRWASAGSTGAGATAPPEPASPSSLAALADITSGNSYAVGGKGNDLRQALELELQTSLAPLARNLQLTLTAAPGYRIGRVYGAPNVHVDGQSALLSSPVSYVGTRSAASDTQRGRRGGGGGWFVELLADGSSNAHSPADALRLDLRYDDALSGERVSTTQQLQTPFGIGQNPPPQQPYFSDAAHGKPFMMLNLYLALSTMTELANQNECGSARGIGPMMQDAWQLFNQMFPDPDISADFGLLEQLTGNIERTCREPIPKVIDVPFSCGFM